jgi:orotidine-5'-phosphate decarboxylase
VIGDVKRGDIGSTAAAYARALLTGGPGAEPETLCDAITVNPYLGTDSITPFLEACREADAGLYVLVRTSNPSSAELQSQGDPPLMHRVAELVDGWGAELVGDCGLSSVGAVVGATHPAELADLRGRLPRTPLLLPGYGAQGAGAADVVGGFKQGLRGALVNSSRGVLFAGAKHPELSWKDACRDAARDMSSEIRAALESSG